MTKLTKTALKSLEDYQLSYELDAASHSINIAVANYPGMRAVNSAITRYNKIAAEARRRGWNYKDK